MRKLTFIFSLFLCLIQSAWAVDEYFYLTEQSKSITVAGDDSDYFPGPGHYLVVRGKANSWAYKVSIYSSNGSWVADGITSTKNVVGNAQRIDAVNIVTSINGGDLYNEVTTGEQHCPDCPVDDPARLAPTGSPIPMQANVSSSQNNKPPSFSDDHRQSHADSYSQCLAAPSRHKAYMTQIKPHLKVVSEGLFEGDHQALLTCLFLRESAHWKRSADSGAAVGLAQFLPRTAVDFSRIIRRSPSGWQSLIDQQAKRNADNAKLARNYSNNGQAQNANKWQNEVRKGKDIIESYKKNKYLSQQWDKMNFPGKTRSLPNTASWAKSYFKDNNNYRNILALAGIKMKSCLYDLNEDGFAISEHQKMLICAGGYNMGEANFIPIATKGLNKTSPASVTVKAMRRNLLASSHRQKVETTDHLLSIDRCSNPSNNYPPCDTNATHCPEFFTDACLAKEEVLCVNERSEYCDK